jgi:hypothetical protein
VCETRQNGADSDEEDQPSSPVPAVVVSVLAMGVVHVADIELHLADEVEIGDEDTGNGTHETGVSREESKELSTFDNDLPGWIKLAQSRERRVRLEAIQKTAMKRAARRMLTNRGAKAEISLPKGYDPAAIWLPIVATAIANPVKN